MKQILQNLENGSTKIIESPSPKLSRGAVKIESLVSLISPGTERMLVDFGKSSYLSKARKQPEKLKMVFDKIATDGFLNTANAVKSKLDQPIPLGYSNVGVINEVSDDTEVFKKGDRVVSNGPHAEEVCIKKNLCALIPENVSNEEAAFTVIGSIALQGVRLSKPTIGEFFVVIGAGLIGLLTIQILKANGCKVLALDLDDKKLQLASEFGAQIFNPKDPNDLSSLVKDLSNGLGADAVIIAATTKSNDPIKQAAEICRKRGRIILVGVVGLELSRELFYEKEINFQVSCSYGPGRYDPNYEKDGNDYPPGYVRWTENRNFQAFLDLISSGSINVKPLITSRYKFEEAEEAYNALSSDLSQLAILLEYNKNKEKKDSKIIKLNDTNSFITKQPVIALIGAGNYAARTLIPALKKCKAQLHTIASNSGINGAIHGKKYGFKYATSDVNSILSNPEINTVFIATRHNTHAKLVIECLKNNKNVWVEKPLAINKKELDEIISTYKDLQMQSEETKFMPQLMIGFNRRFSPFITKIKNCIKNEVDPLSIIITVNPGHIEAEHWTQDRLIGGGRIIGECCHFIDLARFLVGKKITSIKGQSLFSKTFNKFRDDCSSMILSFEDGSIATINYLANGNNKFPKEKIEIFVGGKILELNNFRVLKGYGWKRFRKYKTFIQDKGHRASTKAFIKSLIDGTQLIKAEDIFEVSQATIELDGILNKKN